MNHRTPGIHKCAAKNGREAKGCDWYKQDVCTKRAKCVYRNVVNTDCEREKAK